MSDIRVYTEKSSPRPEAARKPVERLGKSPKQSTTHLLPATSPNTFARNSPTSWSSTSRSQSHLTQVLSKSTPKTNTNIFTSTSSSSTKKLRSNGLTQQPYNSPVPLRSSSSLEHPINRQVSSFGSDNDTESQDFQSSFSIQPIQSTVMYQHESHPLHHVREQVYSYQSDNGHNTASQCPTMPFSPNRQNESPNVKQKYQRYTAYINKPELLKLSDEVIWDLKCIIKNAFGMRLDVIKEMVHERECFKVLIPIALSKTETKRVLTYLITNNEHFVDCDASIAQDQTRKWISIFENALDHDGGEEYNDHYYYEEYPNDDNQGYYDEYGYEGNENDKWGDDAEEAATNIEHDNTSPTPIIRLKRRSDQRSHDKQQKTATRSGAEQSSSSPSSASPRKIMRLEHQQDSDHQLLPQSTTSVTPIIDLSVPVTPIVDLSVPQQHPTPQQTF